MHFEYVMSGLGFTRLKEHTAIDYVADKYQRDFNNASFSVLYNAFTEKTYGAIYSQSDANVYADSGGLQMVTRDMSITDALKDDIYYNQAKHSQFAMCFDEIPAVKISTTGKIGAAGSRYYDRTLIIPKATETARNIKRQIDIFEQEESEAKPVAIIQGNCAETMLRWADVMFEELGPDYLKKVGSVAISGVCIGNATLEEIERSFVFSQIYQKYGIDHLHLLGVGSINRVAPFVLFDNLLSDDVVISYDSTSHTQAVTFGYHFWDKKLDKLKKGYTDEWDRIAERLRVFTEGYLDMPGKEVFETCYKSVKGLDDKERLRLQHTLFYIAALQAWHLSKYIEESCSSFEDSLVHYDPHLWLPLRQLNTEVKTVADYQKWSSEFSRFIPTARVNSSNSSLESLFG